jgi:UDP-N-acetylglucosamine 4,6-dehydratase
MTRFLITLDQGVDLVLKALADMQGGEVFVPKIPSVRVADLARVIGPDCEQEVIGIRPGEKLHEAMIGEDDARLTLEFEDHFVIQPSHDFWNRKDYTAGQPHAQPCRDGFSYVSDTNPWFLNDEEIQALVAEVERTPSEDVEPKPAEPRFIVGG